MKRVDAAENERIRAMVAAGKSAREVGDALGMTRKTVLYRVKAFKLGEWVSDVRRVIIPPEFAAFAARHSNIDTAKRFDICPETVSRWRIRLGLPSFAPAPSAKTPVTSGTVKRWQATHKRTIEPVARDMTAVGVAADYLRRFGPVYRVNGRGAADQRGKLWRRGSAVLTDAELMERADWLRGRAG